MDEPIFYSEHFHAKPMPLTTVLYALAGQEGNDGDEGAVMQIAADFIKKQQAEIEELQNTLGQYCP